MLRTMMMIGTAVALTGMPRLAAATPITFFGEDLSSGRVLTATPKSDAARNAFFANLNGVGTETFEGIATNTAAPITVSFGAAGTATLTGSGTVRSGATSSNQYPISGNKFFVTNGTFQLAFGTAVSAFGFYGTDIGDVGASLTLTLTGSNGTTTVAVPNVVNSVTADGSALYFGFYDTASTYTSVSFSGLSGDTFGFDDFSIGSRQQVTPALIPEPASLALLGAGLLSVGMVCRARRRHATPSFAIQPAGLPPGAAGPAA